MNPEYEQELLNDMAGFQHDPYGFVLYSFPWGEGELAGQDGPLDWQADVLMEIGEGLRNGAMTVLQAIQLAVASGHGVGKSCLVAWIMLWAMSTFEDTKGVVTANTENQLKTKTWAELSKWYRLCVTAHWFELAATALYAADKAHAREWRIDMIPWSENTTEAFAGLHNKGKRILLVFDEASAIPDKIWEVSEGALTDEGTEIIWCVFGNPTRNSGRFRQCFGRLKHRWRHRQIDSRSVPITNKDKIAEWLADYGEDSDFVKVRVRGVFPAAASNQFIAADSVAQCLAYKAEGYEHMPRIMAVDVARFGDDQTVMGIRQGRKVHVPKKYRGLDTMATADHAHEMIGDEKPDIVIVDEVGLGAGVVDRLRQLGHRNVFGFNGGHEPRDKVKYFNRRAEAWGDMRDALKAGLDLPEDVELEEELTAVEYGFTDKQQIKLEKKEDMKKRGLSSPDVADWLSMTFAESPVVHAASSRRQQTRNWKTL